MINNMMLLTLIVGLTIHGTLCAADTQLVRLTYEDHLLYSAAMLSNDYPRKRETIINALNRGADVKAVQAQFEPFNDPLMYYIVCCQDEYLLRKVLKRGADVTVCDKDGYSILCSAKVVSIVQLLLQHGAHIHLSDQEKRTVFGTAMMYDREVGLVELYTSYGFKSTTCNSKSGLSLLMVLAERPHEDVVTKASVLLKDLTDEQKVALIKVKDIKGKNVFDFIETRRCNFRPLTYVKDCDNLAAYKKFLEKQLLAAQTALSKQKKAAQVAAPVDVQECAICFGAVGAKQLAQINCCTGIFHKGCLTVWSTTSCPWCRGNYVTGVPATITK